MSSNDLWSRETCQNEFFASSSEKIVEFDIWAVTSSTVLNEWCGLCKTVFKSLGPMQMFYGQRPWTRPMQSVQKWE